MGAKQKSLREQVFERDNYTCQKCGQRNCEIDIHHIRPRARGGKNTLDNLVTWCKNCHRRFHIVYGIDY